jgi:hypothetical protein
MAGDSVKKTAARVKNWIRNVRKNIPEIKNIFSGDLTLESKRVIIATLSMVFFVSLLVVAWMEGGRDRALEYPEAQITSENRDCITCHETLSPGVVKQWKESKHSHSGIGCYNCHKAYESDPDAIEHNGKHISVIVTPKDCSACHPEQTAQFNRSKHAAAGKILASIDNRLAEVVEGFKEFKHGDLTLPASPASVSGCQQCHGSTVKITEEKRLDPSTWPNSGIGRINPDGSDGNCSACHMRHNFSIAQARMPENCGRCHMGPDHPQFEVYNESKHGVAFQANRDTFHKQMARKSWLPGIDFETGPTCSTCHLGATRNQAATHDVGERVSWNLRLPVSEYQPTYMAGENELTHEDRRDNMRDVCLSCHAPQWVDNWYTQFDNVVFMYNDKFAKPAKAIYDLAINSGLISKNQFDDRIEFIFFELWHHEGRRARHGAAMMGPDYTQWHGMYEVGKKFYSEFVPEMREIIHRGKLQGGARAEAAILVETKLNEVLRSKYHRWYLGIAEPKVEGK